MLSCEAVRNKTSADGETEMGYRSEEDMLFDVSLRSIG